MMGLPVAYGADTAGVALRLLLPLQIQIIVISQS